MNIESIDLKIINFFKRVSMPLARFALFLVFFWFGILKVLGLSPASQMVQDLFYKTIPIMDFGMFLILFGVFECLIGILFLIPQAVRVVMPMLLLHMVTTAGPLVLMTDQAWSGFLVPTMEGQYIIKNILIVALAATISASIKPFAQKFE